MKLPGNPIALGDTVRVVFHPFAWLLDKVWSTDFQGCERCAIRQDWLNDKVPDIRLPVAVIVAFILGFIFL